MATSCKELTHWKRLWCWEGLGAGGRGDDRGWDGWMASLTQWTWVWVNSRSWWWTGRPDMLRFMGSQRVGQDWATERTDDNLNRIRLLDLNVFPLMWIVPFLSISVGDVVFFFIKLYELLLHQIERLYYVSYIWRQCFF